jgi:uncharacterized RDD family membrane protein YckC
VDPEACDDTEEQFAAGRQAAAAELSPLLPTALAAGFDEPRPAWRDEVASRVHSYRARRRRRTPRESSMRLDFDAPVQHGATAAAEPLASEVDVISLRRAALLERLAEQVAHAAQAQVEEPEEEAVPQAPPQVEPQVRASAFAAPPVRDARIIEFPRLFDFPPASELAEPILDRPRILDVPESLENAEPAPLANIALEAEAQQEACATSIEPLQVAPFALRLYAALLDSLIVAVATALFGMTAMKMGVLLPQGKAAVAVAAMVPGLLWAIYQYIFLVYAGFTPGMQMAHLGICTFDDEPARRAARRWRAIAMVLSAAPLGLGLLWALVDEDTLCWHDRMSRSYNRLTQ